MSEWLEQPFEDDIVEEEEQGSVYHSFAQAKITGSLLNEKRFSVFVELSLAPGQIDLKQFGLKAKEEIIPDICLYPKGSLKPKGRDLLKVSEMPLLAIEIVSPKQGLDEILAKFEAYFALGVKSCWLVIPTNESITIYSKLNAFKLFDTGDTELVDEVIDIRLPIQKIFEW
jgi:Uma2 family endonuclease